MHKIIGQHKNFQNAQQNLASGFFQSAQFSWAEKKRGGWRNPKFLGSSDGFHERTPNFWAVPMAFMKEPQISGQFSSYYIRTSSLFFWEQAVRRFKSHDPDNRRGFGTIYLYVDNTASNQCCNSLQGCNLGIWSIGMSTRIEQHTSRVWPKAIHLVPMSIWYRTWGDTSRFITYLILGFS